ncbi:tRNA pseudouridine(13) synthase TruD [Bowmanella yangjiangensis]|uniref:tRNA pseudouridine synthase D n=1 Tax=Bowmanella yangjiangensis TaxID=2811230 RepID=A0ABS3CPJ3_9ALTE|nr:tRNA pseudouridine(13) synthase TruD [Bowmanella yangjiangensis]MBN7818381.1 tRNA pseudouridine(13) synthase TruD [Bowmanella yangjiangensis]
MNFDTSHWHYCYGKPLGTGLLKQHPEDFIVREQLGYSPCGEGEHIYLWVRKTGLNTANVAEQLARFAGVHPRNVSFSGRKDKHAVTEQWIGVHLPGKQDPDWQSFAMPGVEIIKAIRHNRKLRTGTHKFNDFILTIRELSQPDEVADRLNALTAGVPNYFGEQRFGNRNGNLFLGARLLDGETIRDRQKRSMAISALRSWLFNEFVSCRLAERGSKQALDGDVMLLQGSNSFFCAEQWSDELQQRLQEGDIQFSAPMWGQGELASRAQALLFESKVAGHHQALCEGLAALGLSQERRALMQYPEQLQWQIEGQQLQLSFRLQAGGFATAVTRELFNPTPHQD